MNKLANAIGGLTLIYATNAFSMPDREMYATLNAGIFQANFNNQYSDLTDVIPQNISESVLQNGYTGGIALGYNQRINPHFYLGGEISVHLNSHSAQYQSGAATAAFSDTLTWKNAVDATIVSGIITQSSFIPYLKLGLSYATITNNLTSPVGYTPNMTNYATNKNAFGLAAGLGVRHFLNKKVSLFSEINYHDYGTLHFHDFQNFTADYTHTTQLCAYGLTIGAAYTFNT